MIAQNTYLPVKVNVAGIMPVIFASVLMAIPSLVLKILPSTMTGYAILNRVFYKTHPVYLVIEGDINYVLLFLLYSYDVWSWESCR